jgi:NADH-quinone oxidoreductase subunit D
MIIEKRRVYSLNYGPHHPSTHGALRLQLGLDGEKIISSDSDISYIHRGVEKIVETKDVLSVIPYLDRLDYLAPFPMEHAYIMAVEKLMGITPPLDVQLTRVIMDELSRIASHIMSICTMSYDLGCLSMLLYGIEEREKILEIFEEVTGSRMHPAYYVPGGATRPISHQLIEKIQAFIGQIHGFNDAYTKIVLNNRIFGERTVGVGIISSKQATKLALSGPNLRASGVSYDARKAGGGYGAYPLLEFAQVILRDGDAYARNHLRFLEIQQSSRLIETAIKIMPNAQSTQTRLKSRTASVVYARAEGARGEVGIHLFRQEGHSKFHRVRINTQQSTRSIPALVANRQIYDIPAIIGSLDVLPPSEAR